MIYPRFLTASFFLRLAIYIVLCGVLIALPQAANAQNNGNQAVLIRDTEIEDTLAEWLAPLAGAANVKADSIDIILVQNPQLNAFVAGGSNIFFYTGLINKTENPEELLGVMAHELGHIAAGHLIATREALERASFESILGAVLGGAAAVASGNGGAAAAVISGSAGIAQRRFLAHSRVHESSADQAALRYLDDAQINPSGLASFLGKLESEDLLPTSQQSEYIRTHPLSRNRIESLRTRIESSPFREAEMPAHWIEQHARMKAKLTGFITPQQVPWIYHDQDESVAARYARAIAYYRNNDTKRAVEMIDTLIAEEPDNPYFHELKGQMLVDFGQISDALPSYEKAVSLKPDAGLIRIALGHALLESAQDENTIKQAIAQLERALQDEPRASRIRRLLATAYGRLNDEISARLNLAEEAVLQRKFPEAEMHASYVVNKAQPSDRRTLQAKDILAYVETAR